MDIFEVDSIELATPQLFSDDEKINSLNPEIEEKKEIEMFERQDLEEDFEIPAFLRRQKN